MRLLLILAAFAAATPAAQAAPFGELPSRVVQDAATCLRATGTPGELVRTTEAGVELLQGTAPAATLSIDGDFKSCPSVATRPGGTGVLAVLSGGDESGDTVHAFVRDGGRWSDAGAIFDPTPEPLTEEFTIVNQSDVATAVSARGDAVVAAGVPSLGRAQVVAIRRAPGGAFGKPETLFSAASAAAVAPTVATGMSAAGETIVAWAAQPRSSREPRALWVAVAPPGGAFGTPQRVGELRVRSPFDLAVAEDGRALLGFASGNTMRVAERAPGGAFGPSVSVGHASDPYTVLPAVALRADGAALVFWNEIFRGRARAVTRTAPGPFGAVTTLAPLNGISLTGLEPLLDQAELLLGAGAEFGASGAEPDEEAGNPRATYLPDGRALLTWAGIAEREGAWALAPNVATFGGPGEIHHLGADVRDSGSITPLVLADGRAAIAWTDNDDNEEHGRLHLAVEGAADAADPEPPRVSLRGPSRPLLGKDGALPVRVTCSAACDVRLQVAGNFAAMVTLSRRSAGSTTTSIDPELGPIAPLRTGPVKVIVRYAAPGARHAKTRTYTLQLRRRPTPPVPRVLGLSARRSGSSVVVTFRTDRPAEPDLLVLGQTADGRVIASETVEGDKATRFRVTLDRATDVTRVILYNVGDDQLNLRRTTVRVR